MVALATFAAVVFMPPRLRLLSTLTLLKTLPNKTSLELVRSLFTSIFTLCTCARGKAIGFVFCPLSAQKSEQSVSTTKQPKNLIVLASNHIARLTGTTNHAFSVGHTYQPHL